NIPKLAEYVVHIHSASAETTTSFKGTVSIPIVAGAFIRIAKYLVGFSSFLKHGLRFVISRVFIGMVLNRFFAVCFFYFCCCGTFGNAQYFIIIFFHILCPPWQILLCYCPITTFG